MNDNPIPIEAAQRRRKKKPATIIPPGGIDTKTIRPEVEQRLLHLLASSETAREVAADMGLRAADFSLLPHRIIAEGIFSLWRQHVPIEAMALAEWATEAGHVTASRVSYIQLSEATGGGWGGANPLADPAASARRFGSQVIRAAAFRRIMGAFGEMAADQDPEKIEDRIAKIGDVISDYRSSPGVPPAVARALQYNAGKAWPPPATPHNVTTILRHDRRVLEDEDGLWFDERTRRPMLGRAELTDRREARFRSRLSTLYRLTASQTDVRAAVDVVATENPRNPLVERLRALAPTWDGTRRAHLWLAKTFGTPPGPLVEHAAGSSGLYHVYAYRWMLAAVARAFDPGCKVDNMLVLVGEQGHKKGFAFQVLAGQDSIGRDLGGNLQLDLRHPRDCEQQMGSLWICEIAELAALLRTDYDVVKNFVTTKDARFVMKYERHTSLMPRASVLAGTSNDNELFRDPTGDRRYWAATTHREANLPWLRANRDQLWAEVAAAYLDGERQWYLTDEEDRAQRADVENYSRHNATTEILRDALTGIDSVSVNDLYRRFLQYTPDQAPRHEKQVAASMQALGYRRHGAQYSR